MATLDSSHLQSWSPPARPDWVARFNQEGAYLDLSGIIPLDEGSLIDTAIRNTGLKNFGTEEWREPFSILVKGLDKEANLSAIGRILTRTDLLMFLEARLQVEEAYRQHPEIEKQEIKQPIWIIGQGRSGTSLTHTLLAQPPQNITTLDLDGMFPVRPFQGPDNRREKAHNLATMWRRVVPEVDSIHEFDAETPCETFRIEAMCFRAPAWLNLLGLAPSYNAYISQQDYKIAFEYSKRVYKLLQWQNPGKQWVLRSNDSLSYLPAVLDVFPDARLVWSHRDPVRAMASMVDMIGTMMSIRSDPPRL